MASRDGRRTSELRVVADAVSETRLASGDRACGAKDVNEDHAPGLVRDVDVSASGRHADRAHERDVRCCERRHGAVARDDAHGAVGHVGDEDAALRVDGDARGRVEPGDRCRSVDVPGRSRSRRPHVPGIVASGNRAHGSIGIDRANPVVVGVGDDDAAARIDGDADGAAESRVDGGAVAVARHTVACQGRHGAIGGDPPDGVVAGVCHDERAVRRDRDPRRRREARLDAAPVCESAHVSGDRCHVSACIDAEDAIGRARVADEDRAIGGHGDPERLAEAPVDRQHLHGPDPRSCVRRFPCPPPRTAHPDGSSEYQQECERPGSLQRSQDRRSVAAGLSRAVQLPDHLPDAARAGRPVRRSPEGEGGSPAVPSPARAILNL